ncbi:hypothetical protein BGX28_008340, partial [Mortierella sp. GBA30]
MNGSYNQYFTHSTKFEAINHPESNFRRASKRRIIQEEDSEVEHDEGYEPEIS